MSGRKGSGEREPEFVAFVGIDWADQKHVWCLQAADSSKREKTEASPSNTEEASALGQLALYCIIREIVTESEQATDL